MTTILINDANPPVANGVYDIAGNTLPDSITVANSSVISSLLKFYTYAGSDTFDFTAATGSYLAVIYSGSGNDTVNGGMGVETVYDGVGSDIVRLGGNNDTLFAGAGNDTYNGGAGVLDTILFNYAPTATGKGDPLGVANKVGVTVSLSKSTGQTTVFGTDIISGFENITGGDGADKLTGSSAANTISGLGGDDTLSGLGGKDLFYDGAGRDSVIGGTGADEIHVSYAENAARTDKVRYLKVGDSTLTAYDSIFGFQGGGTSTSDRIDLSALLGTQKLVYHGTSGMTTSSAGEVRWQLVNGTFGKNIAIFVDTDKDVAPEMKIIIDGGNGIDHLVKGDFIL
jgi:serralysin